MNPVTQIIVTAIVSLISGGLAGAVVGHWLVMWREKAVRRLVFRNVIAAFIADLEDSTDDGVSYYMASRRTVLVECAKIEGDIKGCCLNGFTAAKREYCELEENERKRTAKTTMSVIAESTVFSKQFPPPPTDKRTPRQKMIDALRKLKDHAG